jgi:glutathione S-transferase
LNNLGDLKITQSNAILRYLGRKNGLDGKTEVEKVRVDMMADNAMDFRNGFVRLTYNPNFATLKGDYVNNLWYRQEITKDPFNVSSLEPALTKFSDFLGDRPYLFVCLLLCVPQGRRCICELYWHNFTSYNK